MHPSTNSLESQFSFENMKGMEFSVEQRKMTKIDLKPEEPDEVIIQGFEAHLQFLAAENQKENPEALITELKSLLNDT